MKEANELSMQVKQHSLCNDSSLTNFYSIDYKLIRIKNAVGFVSMKGVINEIDGKGLIYIPCHTNVACSVKPLDNKRAELDVLSFKKEHFLQIIQGLKPFIVYEQFSNASQMYFRYDDEFDEEFDSLIAVSHLLESHKSTVMTSLSQSIIYKLLSIYAPQLLTRTLSDKCIVDYIVDKICQDLSRKWKLADLAGSLNMSNSKLQRKLKEEDIDFSKLINDVKLKKARDYLTYSDLSITQVANKSGFDNLAYFSNLFKKHYQLTPSQFRRSVRV
ncbi:helix-turn-helix transcriptional regulator [Photobacterium kagoshimensis]|uniref:helix-turn-helix transcriptional regulator n=1 Tax=Photobacterium kagoshimensis TaxID=2910242 RepID=UPI003D13DFB1